MFSTSYLRWLTSSTLYVAVRYHCDLLYWRSNGNLVPRRSPLTTERLGRDGPRFRYLRERGWDFQWQEYICFRHIARCGLCEIIPKITLHINYPCVSAVILSLSYPTRFEDSEPAYITQVLYTTGSSAALNRDNTTTHEPLLSSCGAAVSRPEPGSSAALDRDNATTHEPLPSSCGAAVSRPEPEIGGRSWLSLLFCIAAWALLESKHNNGDSLSQQQLHHQPQQHSSRTTTLSHQDTQPDHSEQ